MSLSHIYTGNSQPTVQKLYNGDKEICERATEPYGAELAELDEKLSITRDEVHKHVTLSRHESLTVKPPKR